MEMFLGGLILMEFMCIPLPDIILFLIIGLKTVIPPVFAFLPAPVITFYPITISRQVITMELASKGLLIITK
jgi:hypothetical protein